MNATLLKTDDLNYKQGYVQCACGWRKELGDGFNGYHIDICPQCTPNIYTRVQTSVTTGRPGDYTIKHGSFVYFVINNGIQVQYSGTAYRTEQRKRIPR